MELRHLRTLVVLSEELHFGRAARRLRCAQSGVSQTLKALEDVLGGPLFVRGRAAVALSPAGLALLPHAREALACVDRGAAVARAVGSGVAGPLSLRFTVLCALTVLPRAVAAFQARYPEVRVSIEPCGSEAQLQALRAGRCDVAFVPAAASIEGLAHEEVEHDTLVALVASGHRLAKRRKVAFADLARERWIVLREENEPGIRAALTRHFARAGAEPDVALELEQIEAILGCVAAGAGVSMMPGFVRRLRFDGVTAVPIAPSPRVGVRAVWVERAISPAARRFLEVLREERARRAAGSASARRA